MKRILLKLSGEALGGDSGSGIDSKVTDELTSQIRQITSAGIQVGIVVGGGNIFRGVQGVAQGFNRVSSDFMGMLATIINAVALANIFRKAGLDTHVMTPFTLPEYVEIYNSDLAKNYLSLGKIVIFAGGTGNPFFTTDSAAALKAAELDADLLIKATKVDGVYDKDPAKHKDAVMFGEISFQKVMSEGLKVMDMAAISLCEENNIPIRVLNVFEKNNIVELCKGKNIGTFVRR